MSALGKKVAEVGADTGIDNDLLERAAATDDEQQSG